MSSSTSTNYTNSSSKRRPFKREKVLLMSPGLDISGNDDFVAPGSPSSTSSPTSKRAAAALLMTSSSSKQALVTPPYQKRGQKEQSSWWDGVVQSAKSSVVRVTATARSNIDDDESSVYSTLQDQNQDDDDSYSQTSTADPPRRSRGTAAASTLRRGLFSVPAKEDAIRQEASFFYRFEDTDIENQQQIQPNLVSETSQQAEDVMHPQYRAAYRARFQQLNELRPEEFRTSAYSLDGAVDGNSEEMDGGDLELRIENEGCHDEAAIANSMHSGAPLNIAEASSLFFVQHGKVLRKLPKDKIRLMMDSQLEPGILSVEHSGSPPARGVNDGGQRETLVREDELTYVLTVDEGLYRRVVQEIVDRNTSVCGLHDCLNEEGKADIKMAVGILVLFLVLLFLNTVGERGK